MLAVSRSPASSSGRQLWRKQTLKLDISAAISDPKLPVIELRILMYVSVVTQVYAQIKFRDLWIGDVAKIIGRYLCFFLLVSKLIILLPSVIRVSSQSRKMLLVRR